VAVSQVSQLQYVYHLYLNDTKSDFILQQALSNQSITDFLIIEYNGDIGGRMAHTNFGEDAGGQLGKPNQDLRVQITRLIT
jgi:hypothetical protein